MLISYYLPPTILTNEELEKKYDSQSWTASKIYRKTGIKSRHIAKQELVSDLAVEAGKRLFAEHRVSPSDIDFLLLCTQSPDYYLPTTACLVQDRLDIPISSGAFDYNLGCSGYIYGLATAKGLLSAGIAKNVLLITAETYTKHIHPLDRSTRTVFGDGATATLLRKEDIEKIGQFVLVTDGKGAPNLIVPTGAMANPRTEETAKEKEDANGNIRSMDNIYMNGPEIYAFTLRGVPDLIEKTLIKNNTSMDQINYVVFHQANKLVLESLREKLEIPAEKYCIDVEDIGNTVSSTIPIALRRAIDRNIPQAKSGNKILIAGFGVGYSLGATVITI